MGHFLDKHDLAARWGVGVGTVEKMITKRNCPRITWIGRNVRFDPADVEAYEATQKEKRATAHIVQLGHPPSAPGTPPPPPRPRERAA